MHEGVVSFNPVLVSLDLFLCSSARVSQREPGNACNYLLLSARRICTNKSKHRTLPDGSLLNDRDLHICVVFQGVPDSADPVVDTT